MSEATIVPEQLALLADDAAEGRSFRPIHYLGNKWRVLDALERTLEKVSPAPGPVCDLFSGSGVVAARLGRRRPVIAADIQEYARVLASAQLTPATIAGEAIQDLLHRARGHADELRSALAALVPCENEAIDEALSAAPERLCEILERGSVEASTQTTEEPSERLAAALATAAAALPVHPDAVLSRYYGGIYFSYEQAAALDGLAHAVRRLDPELRDSALAALLSTTSDVVSSVGSHFAQPVRPRERDGRIKVRTVAGVARRRRIEVVDVFERWLRRYMNLPAATFSHDARRGDYRDVLASLPESVSAVYADPPYTRDHYSRFYHVLETISVGDLPELSPVRVQEGTRVSRGLYRAERHQSPFCIKTEVKGAFELLFRAVAARKIPLVVSYSPYEVDSAARPRLMTIEQITELMAESFAQVDVRSAGRVAHSKLNADRLNTVVNYDAEILIVGAP